MRNDDPNSMIDQQKNRELTMETKSNSQTLSVEVIGTGGDDAVEFISKSLSSHSQTAAYSCQSGWDGCIQSAHLAEALRYTAKLERNRGKIDR